MYEIRLYNPRRSDREMQPTIKRRKKAPEHQRPAYLVHVRLPRFLQAAVFSRDPPKNTSRGIVLVRLVRLLL
jgi:hypothetical protein